MRKERKVILNKMYEVEIMEDIDRQLGCGYTEADFGGKAYKSAYERLYEQLAGTYGMTDSEYYENEMKWADKIIAMQCKEFPFR